MRKIVTAALALFLLMCLAGFAMMQGSAEEEDHKTADTVRQETEGAEDVREEENTGTAYTVDTPISEVTNDPVFGDYGRLIFPVDTWYYSGDTLGDLGLTWYSHIDPDETVEIVNNLRNRAEAGETVFYDIYTERRKGRGPGKRGYGAVLFQGNAR